METETLPIYESKHSEKVIAFANSGYNMSAKWWKETFKLHMQGFLWGIHKTPTGLRRITK